MANIDISTERLLGDMRGVLDDIQKLVDNKDIEGARKLFADIEQILASDAQIELDLIDENVPPQDGDSYDHILHQLLSNINGIIEVTHEEEVVEDVIKSKEEELKQTEEALDEAKNGDDESKKQGLSEKIAKLKDEIAELKRSQEKIKVIEAQLKDLDDQINDYMPNDEDPEPTTTIDPEELERLKSEYQDIETNKLRKNKTNLTWVNRELKILEFSRKKTGWLSQKLTSSRYERLKAKKDELINEQKELTDRKGKILAILSKQKNINTNPKVKKKASLTDLQQQKEKLEKEKQQLEDKLRTTTTKTVTDDSLNLGDEAKKIGDSIFKTHEVRRELTKRDITREDFLAFYEKGIEIAQTNIKDAEKQMQDIANEIAEILINKDKQGKKRESYYEVGFNAYQNGNSAVAISNYEKIRQNMLKSGKHPGLLQDLQSLGFDKSEVTEANLSAFNDFVQGYVELLDGRNSQVDNFIKDQKESIEIFNHEIQIIKDEQKSIEMADQAYRANLGKKAKDEKELRAEQIKASMFGANPDLQKKWDEAFKRFYYVTDENGNKKRRIDEKEITYTGRDGKEHKIKCSTINEYDGYKDDVYFLNLEEYKENLELTTRFRASGNDPYSLTPELISLYKNEEAKKSGSGQKLIEDIIREMEEYVNTFHGNTNEHAVKYATYKTAGSALKAMKPVKGTSPASVKYANAIENVGRFFGIRPPKFKRIDKDGNEVDDRIGGGITLLTDGLVVAAAGAAILAGPIGIATWGAAYAARGIVIGGYQIAANREMRKYGDEIRNNIPTPFKSTKDAKEVARKEYYRTHDKEGNRLEGKTNGKIFTWLRAKLDRTPVYAKRRQDIEQAIVNERVEESNRRINDRTKKALNTILENKKKADENQETRVAGTRDEISSGQGYSDIYENPPDKKDEKAYNEILERAARNQALQSRGQERTNINPKTDSQLIIPGSRRKEFLKEVQFNKTNDLGKVVTEGGNIAATSVTEAQKRLGEQQKVDRHRTVLTTALTGAFKVGIDWYANGITKTVQDPSTVEETPVYRNVYAKTDTAAQDTTTAIDPDMTLENYVTNGGNLKDTYGAVATAQNGVATSGSVDGVAFRVGNIEVSVSDSALLKAGEHVHATIDQELSSMNMEQLVQTLQDVDPINYAKAIEAAGLQGASTDEIAKYMVESGQLYFQTGQQGWSSVLADNLVEKVVDGATNATETTGEIVGQVVDHYNRVPVPGATHKVINLTREKIRNSFMKGAVVGAAVSALDHLHEAERQTEPVEKGTFEEKTSMLEMIRKIQGEVKNTELVTTENPEEKKDPEGR